MKGLSELMLSLNGMAEKEKEDFAKRMAADNLVCRDFDFEAALREKQEILILTDEVGLGKTLREHNLVYFGVGSDWFFGAVLVLEDLKTVEAGELREWWLRAQGLPAAIAREDGLEIREIASSDIAELVRIAKAIETAKPAAASVFDGQAITPENLSAYRKDTYLRQGYGFWSVLSNEDGKERVIGMCGFSPVGEEFEAASPDGERKCYVLTLQKEAGDSLAMSYFLDPAFWHRGLATKMCRAAIEYAKDRLGVAKICLLIHEKNIASVSLAKRLGFQIECT